MQFDQRQVEILDEEMARVLRAKTSAERLAIANGMWSSARRMITGILQDEHPDWDAEQVERETARRLSHGAV